MKSPEDWSKTLARQWHSAELREKRLLSADAWPLKLPIGLPRQQHLIEQPQRIREHLARWRQLSVGEVEWREKTFREAAAPVRLPVYWWLKHPSEWIRACRSPAISEEYQRLNTLVKQAPPEFRRLLVRRRSLWRDLSNEELEQLLKVAEQLEPGMAQGRPLRALRLGVDSKFLERHRRFLGLLLAQRYPEQTATSHLEAFLGAAGHEHWLLVAPLDENLLPFEQLKLRARELQTNALPGERILLVENHQCWHLLPPLPGCIAVLGAGLDLSWLQAKWLRRKPLGYWGDLDTWGLVMLGRARKRQPHIQPLMMSQTVFQQFSQHAVVEQQPCTQMHPEGLIEEEQALYDYLGGLNKGRLEQELLPAPFVAEQLRQWAENML